MKKTNHTPSKTDWAKAIVAITLYIAFLIWIKAWWGAIVIPFILDAYVTKKINWGWWKELENPVTRTIMSWIDAIVFALVAVYFVNIYFFQNYTIPSSSLEKSLLVGDYLFVSKMSYGPRVPQTPLHMPLCQHTLPVGGLKSYIEWPAWDYKRVSPKRVTLNDIVVFNYPAGDSVMMAPEWQNVDYYAVCYSEGSRAWAEQHQSHPNLDSMSTLQQRHYFDEVYSLGRSIIRGAEANVGEVGWRPVDRRENYVKRCVGLPGQTFQIKDRIIYLDGKANKQPDNVQYTYRIDWRERLPEDLVRELAISNEQLNDLYQSGIMPMTEHVANELRKHTDLIGSVSIVTEATTGDVYPLNGHYGWTRDNYGPIWIPERGKSVKLTLDNLPIYERPISIYEGNDLKVTPEGKILINGKETTEYTFKMDYYWMMGDNRHNSADSRYWGFVPEDHVVGKPIMIWLSLDPDRTLFDGGIRWNRLFRWVDNIK